MGNHPGQFHCLSPRDHPTAAQTRIYIYQHLQGNIGILSYFRQHRYITGVIYSHRNPVEPGQSAQPPNLGPGNYLISHQNIVKPGVAEDLRFPYSGYGNTPHRPTPRQLKPGNVRALMAGNVRPHLGGRPAEKGMQGLNVSSHYIQVNY
jgi:hypothetical protein